jgi:hypothetical protein
MSCLSTGGVLRPRSRVMRGCRGRPAWPASAPAEKAAGSGVITFPRRLHGPAAGHLAALPGRRR